MGNEVITKVFCKTCEKELERNHSGPCPNCGGKNKKIETEVTEKITLTESYRAKVKRPGYPKPIVEDRVTKDVSKKTGNPLEKRMSIDRLKQRKKQSKILSW